MRVGTYNMNLNNNSPASSLMGSACSSCSTKYFPPRESCISCATQGPVEAQALSGEGAVYSFTTLRVGSDAPIGLAYVDLDEGVRVLARFARPEEPVVAGTRVVVEVSGPSPTLLARELRNGDPK